MEQVLLFRLGERPYGLEVHHLQEIVESPRLFFIPRAPACYLGAMNFHGSIVPVLDLGPYLGIAGEERDHRVLVLPAHLCPLGLSVAAVRRIVTHDLQEQEPYRPTGAEDPFIRSRFEFEGEAINLLDISRLVASLEPSAGGRERWRYGS